MTDPCVDDHVPESPEAIDAGLVTRALRASGTLLGAPVTDVACETIGTGVGVMSGLTRLHLRYDGRSGGPPSLVAKMASPSSLNAAEANRMGFYEAEVRFYRDLAASSGIGVARCHLAAWHGDGRFLLLLDDLHDHVVADQLVGLTRTQAQIALDAIAHLHAAWWGRAVGGDIDWVPTVLDERIVYFAGILPKLWPVFVDRFGAELSDDGRKAGEALSGTYLDLAQRLATLPWTLFHQDYRSDNIFFADDGRVTVIDWGTIGRGPGIHDVAYLLGGSLAIEDRRRWERDLVAGYHQRLVHMGVNDYPLEDCWLHYRLAQLLQTGATILAGATLDLSNDRAVSLLRTMSARHFSAAADLSSADLAARWHPAVP